MTRRYARPNKMIDEVKRHLKRFASGEPTCKVAGLVLPEVMVFKNHIATVHKIFLRL